MDEDYILKEDEVLEEKSDILFHDKFNKYITIS